ncbi:hypothetical protein Tco_0877881 [Tanacetum coccineum]|uniref:Uncharacterized protein n=1 Tax=Tanacetum coccineum TaxID=301880 RepID=A0ABQ5BWE7_9ASTR
MFDRAFKRQKVDDVQETAEVDDDQEITKIKELMKIVSNKEEVAIDAIPLATKPLSIEDFETLWKLVKAKYGSTRLVEDLDLILYGDLKIMFQPHVEDQLADIFTKALGRERIEFLINKLAMRSFTPETLKQLADEAEE